MRWGSFAVVLGAAFFATTALAQPVAGTAFTYQGRLEDNSAPANGTYDLRFRLFDAASGGAQVGAGTCRDNVVVTDGLIKVVLDFGAVYPGAARWLEVSARADTTVANCGVGTYTVLSPRQALTPAPYALGLAMPVVQRQAVNGAGNGLLSFTNTSTDFGTYAITGISTGNGDGVLGQQTNSSASAPGVHGTTASTGSTAFGVLGEVTSNTPGVSSAGVQGSNYSTGALGSGVVGSHSGSGRGVYGGSMTGYGVVGQVLQGNNTGYALYGENTSPTGYAGFFNGRVNVNGALAASSASTNVGASAVWGELTSPGTSAAGVRGNILTVTNEGFGVMGYHAGSGAAVFGGSMTGSGVVGQIFTGNNTGYAVYGENTSPNGYAGYFNGALASTGKISRAYIPGGAQKGCTPIAYGVISAAGVVQSGSGNFTASYSAGTQICTITITGETYTTAADTTTITPASGATPIVATTSAAGGALNVRLFNLGGAAATADFSFAVFKP